MLTRLHMDIRRHPYEATGSVFVRGKVAIVNQVTTPVESGQALDMLPLLRA